MNQEAWARNEECFHPSIQAIKHSKRTRTKSIVFELRLVVLEFLETRLKYRVSFSMSQMRQAQLFWSCYYANLLLFRPNLFILVSNLTEHLKEEDSSTSRP